MCVQEGQLLLETQGGERFVAFKGEWESRAKGGGQQAAFSKRKEGKKMLEFGIFKKRKVGLRSNRQTFWL